MGLEKPPEALHDPQSFFIVVGVSAPKGSLVPAPPPACRHPPVPYTPSPLASSVTPPPPCQFPLLPALQKHFVNIFSSYLPGNFALKNGGDFWQIFPGLRFPRNEAQKILEKFGENSEQNSGQNPGQKLKSLAFFPFYFSTTCFNDPSLGGIHINFWVRNSVPPFQRRHFVSSKVLAGALFRCCHCDSTHGFSEVLRGHQSERGSAAVCDPNPPHPFAGKGTLKNPIFVGIFGFSAPFQIGVFWVFFERTRFSWVF